MAADTHDPLCWQNPAQLPHRTICPACLLIERIRRDERQRWQPRQPVTPRHAPLCWCDQCIGEAVGPV